jgi:acetoin utilization protein AcuB
MFMKITDEALNSRDKSDVPLTVSDIMTKRVITLKPHHSLSDSVTLMAKHSFRHFAVVDGYRLLGVVSDRDILRVLARAKDWQNTTVSQFMITDLVTVQPDTPISVAVREMLSKRINCLPVVDNRGDLQGIVTSTDLLSILRSTQEKLENQAKTFNAEGFPLRP